MLRFATRLAAGLAAVVLALVAQAAHAQTGVTITPRGSADALDIAAWNIEFFGTTSPTGSPDTSPNDAIQFERVQAVIERSQIDLWAFEEVSDGADFNLLMAAVADDGFAGVLGPSVTTPVNSPFDQKLAFAYRTSVVEPVRTQSILSGTNFGGRAPFELTARVTLGGVTREMRFIALHAKATSDAASLAQRAAGSAQLKAYVDGLIAQGVPVVVMGDFNDELTTSISGGASPYLNFVNDTDYTFATQALNDQNVGTYCGSSNTCAGGSTIDHVLIAGGAVGAYVAGSGDRYGELLTGITQYTQTTSDHLPVLARLTVAAVAGEAGPDDDRRLALLPAAPSPFRTATTLRFVLAEASDVQVEVTDVLGRTVATLGGTYGAGEHRLALDGTGLAAGLYRVRLRAGGSERVQTVVRAR